MLILSVPLRRLARSRDLRIGDTGLGVSAVGYGVLVGGTGAGVILLSLLMASGLEGAAVIATDAAISVVTGSSRFRSSAWPASSPRRCWPLRF